MGERVGDWMQTFTGRQFWPLDPRPEDILLTDIAAALAKLCRYNGHTRIFYSVAEHSVLVARAAPAAVRMEALLHDASEAYLADVPRPLKRHLAGYAEAEDRVMRAVARQFRLAWPLPAEVKRIDEAILADEREQLMADPPAPWHEREPRLGIRIKGWTPQEAEREFLLAFHDYVAARSTARGVPSHG